MSIFEELPYPFHKPVAQELLRTMVALYRTEREAIGLVERHGIDPNDVPPNLTTRQLWRELLLMGNRLGVTRDVVHAALAEFPRNPRAAFIEAILADRPAPASAQPAGNGNPARFIDGTDTVSRPEALLFFDDLTLPVGRLPQLIGTLERMLEIAPAVCLLRTSNTLGGFFGTGFRIAPDLVLTNEHVLVPGGQIATRVLADFHFDTDGNDVPLQTESLEGSVETIVGNREDDWAVIRVEGMKNHWPIVDLVEVSPPRIGDLEAYRDRRRPSLLNQATAA